MSIITASSDAVGFGRGASVAGCATFFRATLFFDLAFTATRFAFFLAVVLRLAALATFLRADPPRVLLFVRFAADLLRADERRFRFAICSSPTYHLHSVQ